ncbi:MAG: branched-chain amino acid transaminase [Acidobacteriota bacterium]
MSLRPTQLIWHNGALVPWEQATVHVMAHGLHYGSAVFEGIRAYQTPDGPAVFRLEDHIRRLIDSARIYRMRLPFSACELEDACCEVVRANGLQDAYVRPIAYRGLGNLAVTPEDGPLEVAIAAFEWGAYLGDDAVRHGVDAAFSSWIRPSSHSTPLLAKACGHYLNAQLIAEEARRNGYGEGLALNGDGQLSEGAGENVFLVEDGALRTPPQSASVLRGITRDSIFELARQRDIEVVEEAIARERIYVADEVFLTGTAAEVTPVRSVDGIRIGAACPGPVTRTLQQAYFGLFDGTTPDVLDWLRPIGTAGRPAVELQEVPERSQVAACG